MQEARWPPDSDPANIKFQPGSLKIKYISFCLLIRIIFLYMQGVVFPAYLHTWTPVPKFDFNLVSVDTQCVYSRKISHSLNIITL